MVASYYHRNSDSSVVLAQKLLVSMFHTIMKGDRF